MGNHRLNPSYLGSELYPVGIAALLSSGSMDDFGDLNQPSTSAKGSEKGSKVSEAAQGQKRPWLKVFETLPPQMLNAYGEAKFSKLSDAEVWKNFCQPLKSGGLYMTELCSKEAERRGIGINRWLHAVRQYCNYQLEPKVRDSNRKIMLTEKYDQFYAEIDLILPSIVICLAPKKVAHASGAASLRSGASIGAGEGPPRTTTDLDTHAAILYGWLSLLKVSRIRMMMNWQSAAGLSFVASVHHRGCQVFLTQGNSVHDEGLTTVVSLEEFQQGIKRRHAVGSSGMNDQDVTSGDFA